jgi:hypothetical protein
MKEFVLTQKKFLLEFFHFLRAPKLKKQNVSLSFQLIVSIFCFIVFIQFLNVFIYHYSTVFIDKISTVPIDDKTEGYDSLPIEWKVLLSCIVAPVLEEISLRLNLYPKWKNAFLAVIMFGISILFFTRRAFGNLYFRHEIMLKQIDIFFWLLVAIISIGFVIAMQRLGNRFYGIYFYLVTIIFSIMHGRDHIHDFTSLFIVFAYHLHHFIFGLAMGFLRVKNGIFASILGHGFYNSLLTVVKLLN